MAVLGVDAPDDVDEIPDVVGQTEGLPIAFRVRTKQEFTNVDFIGLLEGVEVEQPDDDGKDEAEDGDGELTAEDVTAMGEEDDEDGLQGIIDAYELDIDQDDYATYAEVADLIIEELEL